MCEESGGLTVIEKCFGVVAGLACGDALGAPTEFMRVPEIRERYGAKGITDLSQTNGRFTDDTQMAVALALGLLDAAQEAAKTNATPIGTRATMNQSAFVMPHVAKRFAEWSGCYDDQTEVLTDRGWLLFKNLTKEMRVATLNPETHALDYEHPKLIQDKVGPPEMIQFKHASLDLLVTPNHRMYVTRPSDRSRFHFVEAGDAPGTWVRAKRDAAWRHDDVEWFELPSVAWESKLKPEPPRLLPMDDWLEFLGYWLSEGHVSGYKPRGDGFDYKVGISQLAGERCEAMTACAERIFTARTRALATKTGSIRRIQICNKQLHRYLLQFGKARSKFVPDYVKNCSARQISIFLDALWDGDGSRDVNGRWERYSTTSVRLADDVQELLLKVGLAGRVTGYAARVGKPAWQTAYRVGVYRESHLRPCLWSQASPRKAWRPERVPYTGRVYCCTTTNGILYVRRNGIPVWCGNSPENNRAPGNTCMAACRQLRAGVPWDRAGIEGSKGCGAAMRVAPIGLLYSDFVALGRVARASALSTHGHPVAAQAAHAAALAVRLLALGFNPEFLVGTLVFELKMNGGIDDDFEMLLGRIEHAVRLTLRGVKAPEEIQVRVGTHPGALGVAWVADEAVACALYCFLLAHARDEGYVETVRYGANTDGDSDSIACIAGSFAGARWGMTAPKGVPEAWATGVEDAEKLSLLATRIYAVSLLMDSTSTPALPDATPANSGVDESNRSTGTDTIKE